MKRFVFLCPGQGDQSSSMFDLARSHPATAKLLQQFENLLGFKLDATTLATQNIFENSLAQPLVVAATLANWHAIRDEVMKPSLIAGYSVGELSAHSVGGAIENIEAVSLAKSRASDMQACVHGTGSHPSDATHSMVAISGAPIVSIEAMARKYEFYISVITGEATCLISGIKENIERALPELRRLVGNGQCKQLPVKIASHSPLMAQAVATFTERLGVIGDDSIPVLANVDASLIKASEKIKYALLAQLTETVRWSDCMDQCSEHGVQFAFELGPGSALSKMLQARHPHIICRSISDFKTISGAIGWINQQSKVFT